MIVFTIVYFMNKYTTMEIKQNQSLEETWFGRKVIVNNPKIFGFTTCTQILDEKRTKIEPKRKKLMISGYNNIHKSYRLIDLEPNQLRFSRDVIVYEEVGSFQYYYLEFKITLESLIMARDSGIQLQIDYLRREKILNIMRILSNLVQ